MNRIKDYAKLADSIVQWIKDYATENNIKSLVVGVSGGIDSAVVSTLCAMTEIATNCLVIDINSSPDHIDMAMRHIHDLHDRYPTNVFRGFYDMTSALTPFKYLPNVTEHALANTRSRLRMAVLYQIASNYRGIVVGTGNKVEDFGVKFFTKYGDGGVDISPIANLYKSEVKELGRYLGVSEEIINATPTDGLWSDGRSDESVLQCTYEELEWAMEELESVDYINIENIIPFKMLDKGKYSARQMEVIERYIELYTAGMHKVLPIPIYKLEL